VTEKPSRNETYVEHRIIVLQHVVVRIHYIRTHTFLKNTNAHLRRGGKSSTDLDVLRNQRKPGIRARPTDMQINVSEIAYNNHSFASV